MRQLENCFVTPDTTVITLPSGHWIEVKNELGYGEEQALAGSGMERELPLSGEGLANASISLRMDQYNIARIVTWVVDWSCIDAEGRKLPVNEATVRMLRPKIAREIEAALTAHIEAREKKEQPATVAMESLTSEAEMRSA